MSDSISIPTQISFKEMLSHTFPGFFLAFSIFMGIDYLSPVNFTDWAMGSITGLISFAGFIIIMGTILGVIIDGIHHTFIEDDVFDNFEAVRILKMPINSQLELGCPTYHTILSRHFFLPRVGNKGAKEAIDLENHLDEAYYRYSEFYSNIFISLIVFSMISPFYIFDTLNISWRISVAIGIVSFLTACICLICSYTSYKTYLQAQSSAICGFIKGTETNCELTKNPKGKCTIGCNASNEDATKGNIFESLSKGSYKILLFCMACLFSYMFILAFAYNPVNLEVRPTSINFSENITDNGSIKNPVGTLSLKNLGADLDKITFAANGIEDRWLELSYVNDKGFIINERNKITVNDIATGEAIFLRIKLNSSIIDKKNTPQGSYAGSIDIDYRNKSQSIPVRIDLTKTNSKTLPPSQSGNDSKSSDK